MPRRTLRRRSPFDFAYGTFTLFGPLFQCGSAIKRFCNSLWRLGWSPFARRYSGNRSCFLFLRVLRCFNSPRSLYSWQSSTAGLPHSEISGSLLTYSSPKLIVVRHVLHRLLVPRHSPHALVSLTLLQYYPLFKDLLLFLSSLIGPSKPNISKSCNVPRVVSSRAVFLGILLPRKEVIHPHVPVGIPCYDLTPINGPTLDSSLPFGLGHRLRVLQSLLV